VEKTEMLDAKLELESELVFASESSHRKELASLARELSLSGQRVNELESALEELLGYVSAVDKARKLLEQAESTAWGEGDSWGEGGDKLHGPT